MRTKKVLGTAAVAVFAVFAGAAAANPVCQELNGYDGGGVGDTGTWAAITAANGYYYSAGAVKGTCEVKDQTFDGKGPPRFFMQKVGLPGMNRDQCAMYKTSATVRSKLLEGDNASAFLLAGQIRSQASSLIVAGKLDATVGGAIVDAATATERCIGLLLPPPVL